MRLICQRFTSGGQVLVSIGARWAGWQIGHLAAVRGAERFLPASHWLLYSLRNRCHHVCTDSDNHWWLYWEQADDELLELHLEACGWPAVRCLYLPIYTVICSITGTNVSTTIPSEHVPLTVPPLHVCAFCFVHSMLAA